MKTLRTCVLLSAAALVSLAGCDSLGVEDRTLEGKWESTDSAHVWIVNDGLLQKAPSITRYDEAQGQSCYVHTVVEIIAANGQTFQVRETTGGSAEYEISIFRSGDQLQAEVAGQTIIFDASAVDVAQLTKC